MRNDYFDQWLITNGIKNGCDKGDGVTKSQKSFINKELDGSKCDTPCLDDECSKCDKNLDDIDSVTPFTPPVEVKCDKEFSSQVNDSVAFSELPHLSHLSHQENSLTEKERVEIKNEFRLWGRIKCKYCSNLNFKGICSADKISWYRPLEDRWRRCKSYIAVKEVEE